MNLMMKFQPKALFLVITFLILLITCFCMFDTVNASDAGPTTYALVCIENGSPHTISLSLLWIGVRDNPIYRSIPPGGYKTFWWYDPNWQRPRMPSSLQVRWGIQGKPLAPPVRLKPRVGQNLPQTCNEAKRYRLFWSSQAPGNIGYSEIARSAPLLRPRISQPASPPRSHNNDIISYRVISERNDELLIEIQYSYSGIWGAAGWLSAQATKSGDARAVTCALWRSCGALHVNVSNNAKSGRNTACVAMQYRGGLGPQYYTDGIELCLFDGRTVGRKHCETFSYSKHWSH